MSRRRRQGVCFMVYVFLADGFEEIEALTPIDVLRRGGAEVKMLGVIGKRVTGAHGIEVECDMLASEAPASGIEMVVLPGGLPGADHLRASESVRGFVMRAHDEGAFVTAICAAPRMLGELGLTRGKSAVCYPGFEKYLDGAKLASEKVVRDGKLITAAGMGVALEFALELLAALRGNETASAVRRSVLADD